MANWVDKESVKHPAVRERKGVIRMLKQAKHGNIKLLNVASILTL